MQKNWLQMLILLYSDTNYVLDGFHAEFSVTDCPSNCTNHGKCIDNTCICENGWGGRDCSRSLCPNNCGIGGSCGSKRCNCHKGYSGQSCSLHKIHPAGNKYEQKTIRNTFKKMQKISLLHFVTFFCIF